MTTVVVLFNLKPGVSIDEYEKFAREMDIPEVNRLGSVQSFEVFKAQGLLGGSPSPYAYVEILRLHSLEQLGKDTQTPLMQQVVSTFRGMADNPQFIVCSEL